MDNMAIASGESGMGGAIYTTGDLSVNNVHFKNNAADSKQGGAVWSSADTTAILSSTFDGNRARIHAGGILANGKLLTVAHSFFSRNDVGGAIGQGGHGELMRERRERKEMRRGLFLGRTN